MQPVSYFILAENIFVCIYYPAVKAGGMRIVQNKTHLSQKKTDAPVPKPEEESALKVSTR